MSSSQGADRQEILTTDSLTVLTLAESETGILAKRWTADGKIEPVADGTFFISQTVHVRDLQHLADLLCYLETFSRSCIVRADKVPNAPEPHRRTSRRVGDAEPAMIDKPRHWFCLDCDKVVLPFGMENSNPEKVGNFIRSQLPEPLKFATCVVQLSSSVGHPSRKNEGRAHLWFWSEEARDSVQLRAWVTSLSMPSWVDNSTLRAVQPHFTAKPIIENGFDPVFRRVTLLPGVEFNIPAFIRQPIVSFEAARARRHGLGNEARHLFCRLVETSGVLRSKGPHIGRAARLAYLDILVNEMGFDADIETLHEMFMAACIGPQDAEAEADFSEAMQWASTPNVGDRIRAGTILQSIQSWGAGRPDVLASVEKVYAALKSSNVAEMRDRTSSLAQEAVSKGVLVASSPEIFVPDGNLRNVGMPLATNIIAIAKQEDNWRPNIDTRKFLIKDMGQGKWTASKIEMKAVYNFGGGTKPLNSVENVFQVINEAGCAIRIDDWKAKMEIMWFEETGGPRPFKDDDLVRLFSFARSENGGGWFDLSKEFMKDCINSVAATNRYDSMLTHLEWLYKQNELTGHNEFTLDNWLPKIFGVEPSPYHQACGRYLIGGMVNRIINPGIKSDEVVVIMSEKMGLGKSTALEILAPLEGAYANGLKLGMSSKEILELTQGKAIVELDEMEKLRGKDVEAMRVMLSTHTDAARMSYGHYTTERARRFLFGATCNKETPLTDEYGNRRYLPVKITETVDLAKLREVKDHLIRAAYAEYRSGIVNFRLPESLWEVAAQAQEAAMDFGALYERLHLELEDHLTIRYEIFRAADVWAFAYENYRVSNKAFRNAMRKMDFAPARASIDGNKVRVWARTNTEAPLGTRVQQIDRQKGTIFISGVFPNVPVLFE